MHQSSPSPAVRPMKCRGLPAPLLAIALAATITGLSPQPLAADKYEVDPVHSMLIFRVNHLGFSNLYGRFNDLSGSFTVDEENPSNSSIVFEVKAESVDTHSERRDQHLRSPDFLNAKQFPTISFKSTKVKKTDDNTYEVTGEFTLRGVTKPLTVTLTRNRSGKDHMGKYRTGFNGNFKIKRSEFGVNYMPQGIGEEVELLLAIEGLRQ